MGVVGLLVAGEVRMDVEAMTVVMIEADMLLGVEATVAGTEVDRGVMLHTRT